MRSARRTARSPARTFGKNPAHPKAVHMQGLGWLTDSEEIGRGHITTSGIEGAWTPNPTQVGRGLFPSVVQI